MRRISSIIQILTIYDKYDIMLLLPASSDREEVGKMDYTLSYLVAVAAHVTGYFLCKWLESLHNKPGK